MSLNWVEWIKRDRMNQQQIFKKIAEKKNLRERQRINHKIPSPKIEIECQRELKKEKISQKIYGLVGLN